MIRTGSPSRSCAAQIFLKSTQKKTGVQAPQSAKTNIDHHNRQADHSGVSKGKYGAK